MNRIYTKVIGPMPPYYQVAYAVWGEDADFDSDGDSDTRESTAWRELTLTRRPDEDLRIDIDPTPEDRNVIELRSESMELLNQTLAFLEEYGSVSRVDCETPT